MLLSLYFTHLFCKLMKVILGNVGSRCLKWKMLTRIFLGKVGQRRRTSKNIQYWSSQMCHMWYSAQSSSAVVRDNWKNVQTAPKNGRAVVDGEAVWSTEQNANSGINMLMLSRYSVYNSYHLCLACYSKPSSNSSLSPTTGPYLRVARGRVGSGVLFLLGIEG